VSRRATEFASSADGKAAGLRAGSAPSVAVWAIDAGQAFVIAVTPGFTALTLVHSHDAEVGCGYAVVTLVGLGLFGWVLYQRMDEYARKMGACPITVVPLVGVALSTCSRPLAWSDSSVAATRRRAC
jgi:hypothetical protein